MKLRACFAMLAALLFSVSAGAHESLPLVIAIDQKTETTYSATMSLPPAVTANDAPTLRMPAFCTNVLREAGERSAPKARSTLYRCGEALGGQDLRWLFPGAVPAIPTLVRLHRLSGEQQTLVAQPGETHVRLPEPETTAGVSRDYLAMGFSHILQGYDHLLFLLCLMWVAGTPRRIMLAVTGFTLGHSVTLALSALSIVRLPLAPVEACIALSILLLAREIAVGRRNSLIWRHPIVVSALFGLLHGFGFAAALGEIGLPQTQLPAGLLFFNVGVEAGQLAIVAAMLAVIVLFGRLRDRGVFVGKAEAALRFAPRIACTVIGSLSAFWLIERIAGFV